MIAYKEEYPLDYTTEVFALYGQRLNIFAGGRKSRFLIYWPMGMRAYYSAFATFAPEITKRFRAAYERKDEKASLEIVDRYDVPFFRRWSHPFWRATFEVFGVARRYVRSPDVSFSDAQIAETRAFYKNLGLI